MGHRRHVLPLLLLGLGLLGADCSGDAIELLRRSGEGGLTTPAQHAEALAKIAALEENLGGIASETLLERMAVHSTPGVQIAVVNNGRIEWVEAYGLANTATGDPMTRSQRLQGASLSKPTTAVAILKLVQAGLLDLDTPVNDVLTSWEIPDNAFTTAVPVTLRHILSHTSGMNNASFLGYAQTAPVPTRLQIFDGLPPASTPPFEIIQRPGTGFLYSGGAYTVLAQVLEDVTGVDFTAWTLAHLFVPTNMWRSTFAQPLADPAATQFGVATTIGFPSAAAVYPEQPAAGLWSTALDVARFVVAIQEALAGTANGLIDPASAEALVTPQSPAPAAFQVGLSPDPRMGLGLFLADGPEPGWFWHTGGNVGYACVLVGDLQDAGFGAVVMTNSIPGGRALAWEIINGLADLYEWPGWDDWGI